MNKAGLLLIFNMLVRRRIGSLVRSLSYRVFLVRVRTRIRQARGIPDEEHKVVRTRMHAQVNQELQTSVYDTSYYSITERATT